MADYSIVYAVPDPWQRQVTLEKAAKKADAGFNRQMVLLADKLGPPWDVDSLRISAILPAGLERVEVLCGGAALLAFTSAMLRKLRVEDGCIEILRPFLPYLPVSRLLLHECHVTFQFGSDVDPPAVKVHMQRCWPVRFEIPMHQPVSGDSDDSALMVVPTTMVVNNGTGHPSLFNHRPPYALG